MSKTAWALSLLGALFSLTLVAEGVAAQQNMAHVHVGHVRSGFGQTPDGQGLMQTAIAEAAVAAQHAGLAARDLTSLADMQRHTFHVVHALDPSRIDTGPGLGFGVKRAADGVAQHIELAASSDGASQNVQTHAVHVAASARTVSQRAEEMLALTEQIGNATTAAAAAPLVEQLAELAGQLTSGVDADGDGRVGWQEGEGGLDQVEQHVGLLARGEGLSD